MLYEANRFPVRFHFTSAQGLVYYIYIYFFYLDDNRFYQNCYAVNTKPNRQKQRMNRRRGELYEFLFFDTIPISADTSLLKRIPNTIKNGDGDNIHGDNNNT